jgi:hypothetical protein
MPEDYDKDLEPIARYRLHKQRAYRPMSGHGYVVGLMTGESVGGQIIIATASNCDHGSTICNGKVPGTDKLCVEEWQYDYSILWSRTAGGRRLLTEVGTMADKYHNPNSPARRFNAMLDKAS